jgi:hypothetical protein
MSFPDHHLNAVFSRGIQYWAGDVLHPGITSGNGIVACFEISAFD